MSEKMGNLWSKDLSDTEPDGPIEGMEVKSLRVYSPAQYSQVLCQ